MTCDYTGTWGTFPTCRRSACASYQVTNGVEEANGVTGELVTVTCAQGYTGPLELDNNQTGGIVECLANGTFTSFTCTPNSCENLVVPLSRNYGIDTVGVSGVTGDVVTVECMEPYASGTYQQLLPRKSTRIQNTRINNRYVPNDLPNGRYILFC